MLLTSVGVADRIAAGLRERCWHKRIVYLTDILDIDLEGRENLVEAFTTGSSKLDPTQGDEGTHSSEYRLTLNVTEDTIRKAVSRDMWVEYIMLTATRRQNRDHHAVGVLWYAGYEVTPLNLRCCDMAGSFEYEAEHYDLSRAIGQILFDQVGESNVTLVTAYSGSCRSQLGDRPGESTPPDPMKKVAETLIYKS